MIKPYIILENAVEDPHIFVEWAKNLTYFSSSEKHIAGIKIDPTQQFDKWRGHRSKSLHELDIDIFNNIFDNIFPRLFVNYNCDFNYNISAYVHFSPGYIDYDDHWWHIDPAVVFAGVIYLNRNPDPLSGTILNLNNNNFVIENVYNRLVMYDSQILHRPQSCFGDTIDNSRMTLTFFVNSLNIQFKPKYEHS